MIASVGVQRRDDRAATDQCLDDQLIFRVTVIVILDHRSQVGILMSYRRPM